MLAKCLILNLYEVDIGPAGSRAMGEGSGAVLDAHAFPVPIPKVRTSCQTNIHIVICKFQSSLLTQIIVLILSTRNYTTMSCTHNYSRVTRFL